MKHTFLIALTISLFCSNTPAQNVSVSKYFEETYKAELSICDSNYQDAITRYTDAFTCLKAPFSKDIHNALICAIFLRDTALATKYSNILYNRGVRMDYYREKYGKLFELGNNAPFTFEGRFLDNTPSNIDTNLVKLLDTLNYFDQFARKSCLNYRAACVQEVIRQDSINLTSLLSYFNKNKFPDESNYIMVSAKNPPPYALLFEHPLQWKKDNDFLLKYLEDNLNAGIVSPQFFAKCYDYAENNTELPQKKLLGSQFYLKLDGELVIWYPTANDQKTVDQRRAIYHLEPIRDLIRKLIFQESHADFCFLRPVYIGNIPGLPADVKAQLKKEALESRLKYKD